MTDTFWSATKLVESFLFLGKYKNILKIDVLAKYKLFFFNFRFGFNINSFLHFYGVW